MPMPKEIFGQEISNDTPLTVCYRNQANTIVTAHAIGMGLYRKNNGLIQIPGSSDVWETIGYTSDSKIIEGESVELYRTKETSPELLKCNPDEIIDFCQYNDLYEQYESLLKMINENINKDQLFPSDIMIIDMDTIGASDNRNRINLLLEKEEYKNISIHLAGTVSPEDFFRNDSIVYSTIYRAKGNEAYVAYIVNAQRCAESLTPKTLHTTFDHAVDRVTAAAAYADYFNVHYIIQALFKLETHYCHPPFYDKESFRLSFTFFCADAAVYHKRAVPIVLILPLIVPFCNRN